MRHAGYWPGRNEELETGKSAQTPAPRGIYYLKGKSRSHLLFSVSSLTFKSRHKTSRAMIQKGPWFSSNTCSSPQHWDQTSIPTNSTSAQPTLERDLADTEPNPWVWLYRHRSSRLWSSCTTCFLFLHPTNLSVFKAIKPSQYKTYFEHVRKMLRELAAGKE